MATVTLETVKATFDSLERLATLRPLDWSRKIQEQYGIMWAIGCKREVSKRQGLHDDKVLKY